MKKQILFIASLTFSLLSFGQVTTETVSIGASGANQVWYNLEEGIKATHPLAEWDIAFHIGSLMDAGVHVNESSGRSLFLYPGDLEDDWNNVDTTGMVWEALYNSPTRWNQGAFNSVRDLNNQYDYGWGEYVQAMHGVKGNKIFILKLSEEVYKKLAITKLSDAGTTYYFKYANLNGSDEVERTVDKSSYNDNVLVYYSFDNDEVLVREPGIEDWDLVFTNYSDWAANPFTGELEIHGVSGVLSHPEVEIAQVDGVEDVDTYSDWEGASYSSDINVIGYDWKEFDMDIFQYVFAENRVYFVKSNVGEVWKLIFTGYGGAGNGNMIFTKEKLTSLGVSNNEMTKAEVFVYPNPASSTVSLLLNNMANEESSIQFVNMQGQVVYQNEVKGATNFEVKNITIDNLDAGVYFVNVSSGTQVVTQKLIIK